MTRGQREHGLPPFEIWGGVESTVNRVGENYHDQCEWNGHARRIEDLDAFAALGIKALRYPVLWEKVSADGKRLDFAWTDERLGRLRELGVRPIVTLLHHGSGPRSTSLLDPAFPEKLAEYAAAVAERYPWVEEWTPVNEPGTTARFSALYGHWYPHRRDYPSFARALVHECRGTALAMRAIRRVHPGARLVQTEDFGETFTTPALAYQGQFEAERRLLAFDLLAGRLTRDHVLHDKMIEWRIPERELARFVDEPCRPDVIGVNYYLTSDRLLDERQDAYPEWSHGGNERDRYADIEAVRVWRGGILGHRRILERTWRRYGIALALTEVHVGCTRDEQMRWLVEAHDACLGAREGGVDVRALTVWSLLGAFDWNSLVTRVTGFYEPGVFDVRGGTARPTALARLVRDLVEGKPLDHPALAEVGWWRRPARLTYSPVGPGARRDETGAPLVMRRAPRRPLLVTGGAGTLGRAFARLCELRSLVHVVAGRHQIDVADEGSVDRALDEIKPWAVVNAAGFVRVDDAEHERERCHRENVLAAETLARACERRGVRLLTFSTDLVFDGQSSRPYREKDAAAPLSVYGRTKVEAEARVLATDATALVVRTSAFFGPWDSSNFVYSVLERLGRGQRVLAPGDQTVSPTYVPDLTHACLDLLLDGERGIWHLANRGEATWADLAARCAAAAHLDASLVEACEGSQLGLKAPRPRYSVLGSERGLLLGSLDAALERFFDERGRQPSARSACGSKGGK